jgi:hypothetical protein
MKPTLLPISLLAAATAIAPALAWPSGAIAQTRPSSPSNTQWLAQNPVSILAFQTESYSVRIYTRGNGLFMNVFDRRTNTLWLTNIPVVASANSEGYTYVPIRREEPVERVFQSRFEDLAAIQVGEDIELSTLITVAETPPVQPGEPPAPPIRPPVSPSPDPSPDPIAPPANSVATCWTLPHAAFIYEQNERVVMDMVDRNQNRTWLRGVPLTITTSRDGVDYAYAGEIRVDVFTSAFDRSCAIAIGESPLEFGSQ